MKLQENDLIGRTKQFALRIMKLADSMPKTLSGKTIGNQIIRSGTSIAANYREAQRARSKSEFISKVNISLSEAEETKFWLELTLDYKLFTKNKLDLLLKESTELIAIFCSILNSSKEKPSHK